MGNCIEKLKNSQEAEIKNPLDQEDMKSEKEKNGQMIRIKIVLTKEELEWLVSQLENRQGNAFEDVLYEIQRNREKVHVAWKPSLDSIIESPEVPQGMDR